MSGIHLLHVDKKVVGDCPIILFKEGYRLWIEFGQSIKWEALLLQVGSHLSVHSDPEGADFGGPKSVEVEAALAAALLAVVAASGNQERSREALLTIDYEIDLLLGDDFSVLHILADNVTAVATSASSWAVLINNTAALVVLFDDMNEGLETGLAILGISRTSCAFWVTFETFALLIVQIPTVRSVACSAGGVIVISSLARAAAHWAFQAKRSASLICIPIEKAR